ncbi:MAG: ZIP family metal transporter [Candidatus Paceibacterota bacterium]
MITTYLYAFIGVSVVSIVSFVGVFLLALGEDEVKKYVKLFIGLAIGALLGDAFIHLIPEVLEKFSNKTLASILIIAGIIVFLIIEKFLHWHHHENDIGENHIQPAGKLILFTDGFHNLIDGIIIGASFLISTPIGVATTLAVILHEIPQEIGDFAVLIHSGYTAKRALFFNFLSALAAILGVLLALIFGSVAEIFTLWILPISAGGFIYIALADLIPELQKTKELKHSIFQILTVLLGILTMVALLWLE